MGHFCFLPCVLRKSSKSCSMACLCAGLCPSHSLLGQLQALLFLLVTSFSFEAPCQSLSGHLVGQCCACTTARGLAPSRQANPQLRRQETWAGWTRPDSSGAGGSQQCGLHGWLTQPRWAPGLIKWLPPRPPQHLRSKLTLPTLALPHPIGWGTSSATPDWLCLWSVSHTGAAGMAEGMGVQVPMARWGVRPSGCRQLSPCWQQGLWKAFCCL